MRSEAFQQGYARSGLLVLSPRLLQVFLELALHGLGIGKHQFSHDDLGVSHWIYSAHVVNDILVFETSHHVNDGVYLPDVGKELVSQTFSLAGAFHEARDVHHLDCCGYDSVCARHVG